MNFSNLIATQVHIRPDQAQAAIELLDAGNTLPFIARYRKEATAGLDEEQLRQLIEMLERLRALDERRETVLKSISEQGLLNPQLEAEIRAAATLTALEDLYQPYRPKRRTRASVAREKGLQPLADLILQQASSRQSLEQIAAPYLNDQVPDAAAAWQGACDIAAEVISDHPEVRRQTRQKALQWAILKTEKIEAAEDPRGVYELYYQGEHRVDRLRPHQILAVNRGEKEKVLRTHLIVPERDWQNAISSVFRADLRSPFAQKLQEAAVDSAERLLLPAIERDVRRELTEKAESHAIAVFGANLRALLSQPPLAGQTVLGIDPGFRTGCKVAVVDPSGKLLDTATIYPHEPQKEKEAALKTLGVLALRHRVTLIAIGNGTASRETEQLAAELIRRLADAGRTLQYLITSEAGASVYSASPLARAELPQLDVSLRGAVSIARRVQDPLAELVKIDPRSIGVGMYQHDVDQKKLVEALAGVVESVVNAVGVDVNTASPALLAHVSGIGPSLASNIFAHREANGPFMDRAALRKVPKLGPKAFEQAAGFLRIREGRNPLDASAIHPESYPAAEKVLRLAGLEPGSPLSMRKPALEALLQKFSLKKLAAEAGCGVPTTQDILGQLVRPGRDPREETPAPVLRSDVLKMEDLAPGMCLKGTVRNVVDFGVFIDIGVKNDGLLHRSQVPQGTVLKVGDILEVEIQKVEAERGRVSLGWAQARLRGS
jgi:protein Tex